MGQQDGVDRVPVTLLLLEDLQPPPEKTFERLILLYQGRFRHCIQLCLRGHFKVTGNR